jgi:putative ATP-binding cassette transporter
MKHLLSFLFRYSPGLVLLAMIASVLTGAANAALIAVVNRAIAEAGGGGGALVRGFIALCVLLPLLRVVADILITVLGQRAVFDLRMHLSRQILASPLRELEKHGSSQLLATLTGDVMTLSNALGMIPFLSMNLAVFVFCLAYLALLYWPAAIGVLAAAGLGVLLFSLVTARAQRFFRRSRLELDDLFEHFRALTSGTKELKLHRRRRTAFLSDLLQMTASSFRRHQVLAAAYFASAASMGHIFFFIAIGVLIFFLPARFPAITPEILTGYSLVLLYLIIPLTALTSGVPMLGLASVALSKIESLGMSLSDLTAVAEESATDPEPEWRSLELAGVTHRYHRESEDQEFVLGPIDLRFAAGELVFVIGGNGSGKTTLAKLLCGLYRPESGEIRFDGAVVDAAGRDAYRQYFTVVFSDFFLFEKLLGIEARDLEERARHYLGKLQLERKVTLVDGTLSTLDLSHGQRKRLALLTAYLEDRPIYLFDEWAADQDPAFKEIFYYALLPELKARGKTVIVISHDDHYYHVADRLVKLDYGKIEYDRPV